ncbi:putative DNA repair protein [Geothermobacter ehrlichii]|uniref:Putative DNA repair protein n=1 Tax=Geothermobacter ehrlichii TaxID=213224 RepID=A0A5D3WR74_9BACT|nr:PD-(D/E)XK nuclease family protein [Geothermobacter ehrlichii]TYP00290.1 putative DNA repair protein [Geothermobacter ehrlichii]
MTTAGEALDAAAAGALVLTVNRRLAGWLTAEFDRRMQQQGRSLWPRPAILPLKAWIAGCIGTLGLEGRVLSERQVLRLWEEVIEEDLSAHAGLSLLRIAASARQAAEAQRLLLSHEVRNWDSQASEECRVFARWLSRWEQKAGERGWLSLHHLPALLIEALHRGRIEPPSRLYLAGFDSLEPVYERLMDVLRRAGCDVEVEPPPEQVPQGGYRLCRAADPDDEVRQCARWVRFCLERQPDSRIGIVVPRLDEYRGRLQNALLAELDAAGCLQPDRMAPVNFSLGLPLDREGPVRAALTLVGLGGQVELADISWLLRSPFVRGGDEERQERARLDLVLREREQRVVSLARLRRQAARQGRVPAFVDLLDHLLGWNRQGGRHLPGSWAERMANLLEAVGWPGDGKLDSRSWQAVDRFMELLTELASLDPVATPMGRQEAVSLVARLARETEFQTDRSDFSVQVLGLLESAGQHFDHLWIMGLHDGALPVSPSPNPFLPLALQRQYGMPHADAERELAFARNSWRRLLHAAGDIVVSWPAMIDGAEYRPSPLIDTSADVLDLATPCAGPVTAIAGSRRLVAVDDGFGPPLPPGRIFSGGTGILRDQALCPFRAFLHYRLLAEALPEAESGLDGMSRGTLVHNLLQEIWRQLQDLDGLRRLSESGLENLLATAAEQAVGAFENREKRDLPPRQRMLEIARLRRLGRTWLALEREREAFSVEAIEKDEKVRIGGLLLRTRVDRIDRLADGRRLVIDYKTGQPDHRQWFDDRVTEPQLPLYCLQIPAHEVAGAVFARVHCRSSDCRFYGVVHPDSPWQGNLQRQQEKLFAEKGWDDWLQLVEHWRRALAEVADEFVAGRALVDPTDSEKACRYCDGLPVCRLLERQQNQQDSEAEA